MTYPLTFNKYISKSYLYNIIFLYILQYIKQLL
nr:MAG TPA: hypothetical protein [Caudoviricetes sp.]